MKPHHDIYVLYADLLDYPSPGLIRQLEACLQVLGEAHTPAREMLLGFQDWVRREPLSSAEETYTSTFDLQGICCPYVGHYLFGDNYQRSWFMAKLNKAYREKGFSCEKELPDHVTAILRYLAWFDEDEFGQVLLTEGLMPSMEKMIQSFSEDGHHPYAQVLRSLFTLLQEENVRGRGDLAPAEVGGSR